MLKSFVYFFLQFSWTLLTFTGSILINKGYSKFLKCNTILFYWINKISYLKSLLVISSLVFCSTGYNSFFSTVSSFFKLLTVLTRSSICTKRKYSKEMHPNYPNSYEFLWGAFSIALKVLLSRTVFLWLNKSLMV